MDDTIKSAEDLDSALGLPVLGRIHRMPGPGYSKKLSVYHGPFSPTAESYRVVRANLRAMGGNEHLKSILVSSAGSAEGKSVTSANLAVALAQSDLRTILVDADMRMPSVHKLFQISNRQGLFDLLRHPEEELRDHIRDTGIQNLQLITSGPIPANSAGMLASKRMDDLVQELEKMADVIVFDSPPVLALADATVLAQQVDGAVLVVHARRTRRNAAKEAVARLNQVGANILGAVLNQVPRRASGYYSYYYKGRQAGELPQKTEPVRQRSP
jgi:non-specific protein-tyrosine kinase